MQPTSVPGLTLWAAEVAAVRQREPQLTLLGGFGLCLDDRTVSLSPGAQRLIALLALHDTALSRDYVAGMLWGDSTQTRASGSLRSTLWKLRVVRPEVVCNQCGSLGLAPR